MKEGTTATVVNAGSESLPSQLVGPFATVDNAVRSQLSINSVVSPPPAIMEKDEDAVESTQLVASNENETEIFGGNDDSHNWTPLSKPNLNLLSMKTPHLQMK